jgi:peptidoglycan/LPS O-acetylase OafA/YrhL
MLPIMTNSPATVSATALGAKPHYAILDGLRGVAALTVVAFHLCEAHATSHLDQLINHGYLAVDFFFLLSGYVIGYAYDDRWERMSLGDFFRARLVRLQPLVVLGMLIGAALFYCQTGPLWPGLGQTPVWLVLLVMSINATTLPVPLSMDVRGWHEMHPLNGPAWSLFYEYIANMLYALGVRKLSNAALGGLVALAGAALVHYLLTSKGGLAPRGRGRRAVVEWLVRGGEHRPAVSADCVAGRQRAGGRGGCGAGVQVFGRRFVPDLHHALPAHLHLHGLGGPP